MSFDCSHEHVRIETLSETYEILGEIVKVNSKVKVCEDCGEKIFDTTISNKNILNAYSVYRKHHNLLDHEELKKVREDMGVSKQTMAVLLGVSPDDVRRHEAGAIQTYSYDKKVRKLMTVEGIVLAMSKALRLGDDDSENLLEYVRKSKAE